MRRSKLLFLALVLGGTALTTSFAHAEIFCAICDSSTHYCYRVPCK
jgi:hypothetical protein